MAQPRKTYTTIYRPPEKSDTDKKRPRDTIAGEADGAASLASRHDHRHLPEYRPEAGEQRHGGRERHEDGRVSPNRWGCLGTQKLDTTNVIAMPTLGDEGPDGTPPSVALG